MAVQLCCFITICGKDRLKAVCMKLFKNQLTVFFVC